MTTESLTLTDFLLARITEDERDAQTLTSYSGVFTDGRVPMRVRCDPRRVLAECEAKRRIVGGHEMEDSPYLGGAVCGPCSANGEYSYGPLDQVLWPCPTLRAIATVYADHPDFREEWRP